MGPRHEETDWIDGYRSSSRNTKTVTSNGLGEVFCVVAGILLIIPIGAFLISGAIVILRQVQTPPKCSESLTTRYAVELGRFRDG